MLLNNWWVKEEIKKYLKTYENGNIGYQNLCMHAKLLQLYPIFCDPMDCSLLGSSVHGILQARVLEWTAMPSSRGIFLTQEPNEHPLCLLHWQVGSLPLLPPGKPVMECSKGILSVKCTAINAYLKKQTNKKPHINNLNLHLKKLEKILNSKSVEAIK